MERDKDQDAKSNALYMYHKMADQLRDDAIAVLESGTYSYHSCMDFRHRYLVLRELMNNLSEARDQHGKDLALPDINTDFFTSDDENLRGLLSSVIMATGQLKTMIEGFTGSFDREMDQIKKENIQLRATLKKKEDELKKIKPAIPAEIIAKIPSKLSKTINSLNFNYANLQWDSTAMLSRKLISDSIDIKFRMIQKLDRLIDKSTGKEYGLPKKINICETENFIKENTVKKLTNTKIIQDAVTHSYKIEATPDEIERMVALIRLFLEELFS